MHSINYVTCGNNEIKKYIKWIEKTAFDPQESSRYHGDMTIHDKVICKDRDEAEEMIKKWDRGWYSDHAVRYKDGRKLTWLIKYEYHC